MSTPPLSGQTNNFISRADNYGTQTNHWNGVEIGFTARVRSGLTFQGGTQHRSVDHRQLRDQSATAGDRVTESLLSRRAAVQNAAEGPRLVHDSEDRRASQRILPESAGRVAQRELQLPERRRSRSRSAAACQATRNLRTSTLSQPGDVYGDRVNQIDMRVGKILKFGRMAHAVQPRPLQHTQLERHPDLQPELHRQRGVADADVDTACAVRETHRADRFLVGRGQ